MEIVKASQLGLPHISGTVNVPLAELDRMRADHALAVKLAKELEERQAEVRVVYSEQSKVFVDYDRNGRAKYRDELVEKKVEYKGFDEFRDRIADEEKAKVQKEITRLKENLTVTGDVSSKREEQLVKVNSEKAELAKTLEERVSDLNKALDEISMFKELANKDRQYIDHLRSVVKSLTEKLRISRNEKSFWYWLINKF